MKRRLRYRARAGRPRPWWIRPVSATVAIVAFVLIWQVAQAQLASAHVSEQVDRALDEQQVVNVVVTLPFEPERFHTTFFSDCCSIVRVEEKRFYLEGVSKSDVRHIGEQFWVDKVGLWGKDSGF